MGPEPLPEILYWLRVTNNKAQDYGRVGRLVGTLGRPDDPDLHPYLILDFGHGETPGAFAPDECSQYYAV